MTVELPFCQLTGRIMKRYTLSDARERFREFARNPDMELPVHRDREFGLKTLRRRVISMVLVLFSIFLGLLAFLHWACSTRYNIVQNRIDGRIEDTRLIYAVFYDVKSFMSDNSLKTELAPHDFQWRYLKEGDAHRGGLVLSLKKGNPFSLPEGALVIALPRSLIESGGPWYFKARPRNEAVRDCACFITILHELIHHVTGSHEEALAMEKKLMSKPPEKLLQDTAVSINDWEKARTIINEFVREI